MKYADTSFLVSSYTPDANSSLASASIRTIEPPIILTSFGEVRLTNAFERRLFRHELTAAEVAAAHSALRDDIEAGFYFLIQLPVAAFSRAQKLTRQHTAKLGTRTLDLPHVASALTLESTALYTFDRNQRQLAAAVGLKVPAIGR